MLTMSSSEEPVTDKMQATSNIKKVGAALGVLGLVFGKKNLDGPGKWSEIILIYGWVAWIIRCKAGYPDVFVWCINVYIIDASPMY